MAIDPSIALGIRPVQLDNPLDVQAKQAQLGALINQQRMQDMAFQRAQEERTMAQDAQRRDRTLGDVFRQSMRPDGTIDRNSVLAAPGLGASQIQALQNQFRAEDKDRADIGYKSAQTRGQVSEVEARDLKTARDRIAAVNDRMTARLQQPNVTHDELISDIVGLVQAGVVPPEMGQQMVKSLPSRPESLRSFLMNAALEGLDNAKRIDLLLPKTEVRNMGGSDQVFQTNQLTGQVTPGQQFGKTATQGETLASQDRAAALRQQAADAAAGRSVQIRGQNLSDARARESSAASLSKPFEVTGPEGTPILVQQAKDGSIRRVEGFSPRGGADKPLTDAQSKALLFGARMKAAEQVLEANVAKGVDRPSRVKQFAEGLPLVGQSAAEAANLFVASPEQQQVEQAQRDFINAVLRRESGAVIADSEFDNARKQYFPQIGDDAATKAQKKRNREIAQRGILAEVPNAARGKVDEVLGNGQRLPTTDPVAPTNMRGGAPKPLPRGTDLGGGFKLN
jgi:hypothetical protein